MKQEDKELLLKDLYARLPYGVKFKAEDEECIRIIHYIKDEDVYIREYRNLPYWICTIKPYLRSIHKLTKEELEELEFLTDGDYVDYCNKHHIDYRNLIPKGLALEAKEGMYEY